MDKDLKKFSNKEFKDAYDDIYSFLVDGQSLSRQRCAYVLGGQPGAEKSNYFLNNPEVQDYIILNGDDYRKFHPRYDVIARDNMQNMPGQTQSFCNKVIESLIDELSQSGYNMIIEGTLRNPDIPVRTCVELKCRKYHVNLVIVACDAEMAWKATLERAAKMAEHKEYPRFVPIDLYNNIVSDIVDNLEEICKRNCFDSISVIDRDGVSLYPNEKNLSPTDALKSALNSENWKKVYEKYKDSFEIHKKQITQLYADPKMIEA